MLTQNFGTLRQYVPAELKHNSRGWYIEYYRLNPTINMNERVRLMMNRERKRKHLAPFIVSIVFQPKVHTMCGLHQRWEYVLQGNGMNANSIS